MTCKDCCYFWRGLEDEYAFCHYFANDGYAPCEVDEPTETEGEW